MTSLTSSKLLILSPAFWSNFEIRRFWLDVNIGIEREEKKMESNKTSMTRIQKIAEKARLRRRRGHRGGDGNDMKTKAKEQDAGEGTDSISANSSIVIAAVAQSFDTKTYLAKRQRAAQQCVALATRVKYLGTRRLLCKVGAGMFTVLAVAGDIGPPQTFVWMRYAFGGMAKLLDKAGDNIHEAEKAFVNQQIEELDVLLTEIAELDQRAKEFLLHQHFRNDEDDTDDNNAECDDKSKKQSKKRWGKSLFRSRKEIREEKRKREEELEIQRRKEEEKQRERQQRKNEIDSEIHAAEQLIQNKEMLSQFDFSTLTGEDVREEDVPELVGLLKLKDDIKDGLLLDSTISVENKDGGSNKENDVDDKAAESKQETQESKEEKPSGSSFRILAMSGITSKEKSNDNNSSTRKVKSSPRDYDPYNDDDEDEGKHDEKKNDTNKSDNKNCQNSLAFALAAAVVDYCVVPAVLEMYKMAKNSNQADLSNSLQTLSERLNKETEYMELQDLPNPNVTKEEKEAKTAGGRAKSQTNDDANESSPSSSEKQRNNDDDGDDDNTKDATTDTETKKNSFFGW